MLCYAGAKVRQEAYELVRNPPQPIRHEDVDPFEIERLMNSDRNYFVLTQFPAAGTMIAPGDELFIQWIIKWV
jgi:hypothetical protein